MTLFRLGSKRCLMCKALEPISGVFVWEKGKIVATICASHTLYEVMFWNRGRGRKRLFVDVTRGKDE